MSSPGLFDDDPPPPHSREGTSEWAAKRMMPRAGTVRRLVLDEILKFESGLTCEQVCDLLGLPGSTVRPRIWELRGEPRTSSRIALIKDSGRTRTTRSGQRAIVWVRK